MTDTILIFSEDIEFHLLSKHVLMASGYQVILITEEADATTTAIQRSPLAIVLDCRRESSAGVTICKALKNHPKTRSILIVAVVEKGNEAAYIKIVEAGADRVFHRPTDPADVIDFLHHYATNPARLQRYIIELPLTRIDTINRKVFFRDKQVILGQTQYLMLKCLLEIPGKIFRRDELIEAVWPDGTFVDDRTVDVHIGVLRKALREAGAGNMVRTVRGAGYTVDLEWLNSVSVP
ncbi:response regulator transcription factor [Neorhizobium sp. CSC1952]|uniref:winged helix-turn-helix transcriptional regulator n=1 Tax=Neorhizobium sp. CSC1952 TaxID=2978974 RepID=UPI0025A580BD|nr:response regulator transcription factor [Rhizobium sp. CSC1952]WJR65028.1 response regulator transcription factor [Rhizobium sp. CSC1952]